jgi:hypothetical protein
MSSPTQPTFPETSARQAIADLRSIKIPSPKATVYAGIKDRSGWILAILCSGCLFNAKGKLNRTDKQAH